MILATHGVLASQIASFDADAQAFFDRVTTAGGTLTTTEKNATNQLVLDMKSAGIWSAMKAVYPMVGASAAACAQNLKSSSFTGTFTTGWTFASTGVTPNGTSAYMDTGYNVDTQGLLNSAHMSAYIRQNIAGQPQIGCFSTFTNAHYLYARFTDNLPYIALNSNEASGTTSNAQAFWIGSRINSTIQKLYRNNSTVINSSITTTVKIPRNIYIGAANGPSFILYGNTETAFNSIGDGLTDTQASNFYTAVQAFQTTLSRQV